MSIPRRRDLSPAAEGQVRATLVQKASPPFLVGVGGASCSGKSTLVQLLAHSLGGGGSGATGAGVANGADLPLPSCTILHQDRYYHADSDIPTITYPLPARAEGGKDEGHGLEELAVQNWDCPEALDMRGFGDLLAHVAQGHFRPVHHALGDNRPTLNPSALVSPEAETQVQTLLAQLSEAFRRSRRPIVLVDGFLLYSAVHSYMPLFDLSLFLHASRPALMARRARRNKYVTLEGTWEEPPAYFDKVVWPGYLVHNRLPLSELQQRHDVLPSPPPPALAEDLDSENLGSGFFFLDSEALGIEQMLLQSLRWIVERYAA